jgi:signal-transduction protein with cAMP-binding, CBS, and nucleotidyltransferase domain
MKVEDVYTHRTVHIPVTCTLREAAIQMRDQHIGALIVTTGDGSNRIVGMLTDRDIVLNAVASGEPADPARVLVGEAMSGGPVATIDASADLSEAMQAMCTHGVRRLAVTTGLGDIGGVLSLDDVIDAFAHDYAMLASVLRSEQNRERTGSVQTPLHF